MVEWVEVSVRRMYQVSFLLPGRALDVLGKEKLTLAHNSVTVNLTRVLAKRFALLSCPLQGSTDELCLW